jgi:hypothetical protein
MNRDFALSSVLVAAGLFAFGPAPAFAQERPSPQGHGGGEHAVSRPSGGEASSPAPSSSGGGSSTTSSPSGGSSTSSGGGDHAVSRGSSHEGRRGGSGASGGAVRGGNPKSVVLPSSPGAYDPGDRGAPGAAGGEYARPRGNRPTSGYAVPRRGDISNVPDLGWRRDPYWAYGYWQYDRWMPFYYGLWGSYFYYDPFWWDYYYGYAPGYYSGGGGGSGYVSSGQMDYDTGSLKLKVRPRNSQVYVDGYFSGVVDDYDGVFQKLKLRAGAHRVELRAEGFFPSIFDVLIVEGETVTYRAELKPKP